MPKPVQDSHTGAPHPTAYDWRALAPSTPPSAEDPHTTPPIAPTPTPRTSATPSTAYPVRVPHHHRSKTTPSTTKFKATI